jgi:hypothetical protein
MANHDIPRRNTTVIEELHGFADDGRPAHCRVYRHVRQGHTQPEFYVLQWLERPGDGRMDRATRVTSQVSGARAEARLEAEMAEVRALFAASRESR